MVFEYLCKFVYFYTHVKVEYCVKKGVTLVKILYENNLGSKVSRYSNVSVSHHRDSFDLTVKVSATTALTCETTVL